MKRLVTWLVMIPVLAGALSGCIQTFTGEDIEDGTIEGVDIKDDSITWRDIKNTRRIVVAEEPPVGDGDGDYGSIGEALNNAVCGEFNPCVILVMPGTYEENIRISNQPGENGGGHIHIMGSGIKITTIRGQNPIQPVIDLDLTNHIVISGLTIEGGLSPIGIRIKDVKNVTLMQNEISDNRDWGISIEGFNPKIMHNSIYKNGDVDNGNGGGIFIDNASTIIFGNELRENWLGINSNNLSSPKVFGNRFIQNTIGIHYSQSTGEIVSNSITGRPASRAGIMLGNNSSPLIKENRISGVIVGIEFGSDNSSPTISENRITGTRDGILLIGGNGSPSLLRNTIKNNSQDGIRVESSSAALSITGNTVLDNERYGIFMNNYRNTTSTLSGGGAIISHNSVYSNSSVDVRVVDCVNGSHVTLSHNIVNVISGSSVCVEGGLNTRVNGTIFPQF